MERVFEVKERQDKGGGERGGEMEREKKESRGRMGNG